MKMNSTLSIVIPTCNRPELLDACLRSVREALLHGAHQDIEVVVTDDSPTDDSQRLVQVRHPQVRWSAGPRRGPASNRNAGVRAATGSWILFVDDDCIVTREWVLAYLRAFERFPDACVFEGKTVADRPRRRMDEESPVNEHGGYLWSCNMAIRRDLFEELGGFCESFPYATMEDVDLRLRIASAGHRFPFIAEAVVCHPYRASKGLQFVVKNGRSYLHLVDRHPDLVTRRPILSGILNAARRAKALMLEAVRCRFKGFPFAAGSLFIIVYYDFVARLRSHGSSAS
jgi:GT2 family glycosyltransferase